MFNILSITLEAGARCEPVSDRSGIVIRFGLIFEIGQPRADVDFGCEWAGEERGTGHSTGAQRALDFRLAKESFDYGFALTAQQAQAGQRGANIIKVAGSGTPGGSGLSKVASRTYRPWP